MQILKQLRNALKSKGELLQEIESLKVEINVLRLSGDQWRKATHIYADAVQVNTETNDLLISIIENSRSTLAGILGESDNTLGLEQLADMAATHIMVLEDRQSSS